MNPDLSAPRPPFRRLLAGPLLVFLLTAAADAQEPVPEPTSTAWPQWGGPERDFSVPARPLARGWPEDGPPKLWSRPLGAGHSGIASDGDTVYTLFRRGEAEVTVALSASDGAQMWSREHPAALWQGFNAQFGEGPHTTPLIEGDALYTVDVRGVARKWNRHTGEVRWSLDLWQQLDGEPTDRGYASSPLAHGGRIVLPVPGNAACLVAIDGETGRVAWKSGKSPNGAFSSPIVANVGGMEQIVAFMAQEIVGLDPDDGTIHWRHPHPTKYGINAMTPVWGRDNLLFVSAAYDSGSRMLRFIRDGARTPLQELWAQRKMKIHHGSALRLGRVIVGSSGDFGPAFLTGLDAYSGELLFRQRGFAKANLLAVGDRILILDEDGVLALARLGGEGLEILERSQVLRSLSWAAPALVGTTLFLRDQREVLALDLSPPGAGEAYSADPP